MSDETLDGGSPNGGTPTSPNAGGSQGQSVSGSSGNAQTPQTEIEKKLAYLETQYNALKSEKDRGVSRVEKRVDDFEKKFDEVQKLISRGYSRDEAFEQIQLKETVESLKSQIQQGTSVQTGNAGNGNGSAVDRAKTLQQYGLSENDPDVAAELNGKAFASEIELENAALKIAFKRANRPQPDASAAPVAQGAPVTVGSNAESVARLEKLQQDPIRNRKEIAEIEKALGW